MMSSLRLITGLVAGLALIAMACSPSAAPENGENGEQEETTTQPSTPASTSPATAETSVSGIPLDPDAKFGGVLVAAYTSEGPTFSPWEETIGVGFIAGQPISNMLIQPRTWGTNEDYQNRVYFEIHPDLATSWEQASDGLSWTFKLRSGVQFEDGAPFTCADVKWSFDTIRTGEGLNRSPRATHFRPVDSIECVDDTTIVFRLKWAAPSMIDKIGMPYNMVYPKHKYENDLDSLRETPNIGTGPFRVEQWIPGEKITLVKKDSYWDQPFPYLDEIEYIFMTRSTVPTALRAGRIHHGAYQGYQGSVAITLADECDLCRVYDPVIASSFSNALYVNQNRAPWNQIEVKMAIAYALDRVEYVQLVHEGYAMPPVGGGFYPGSFWAMPEERVKTIPGFDFDNPEANQAKARELLAEAGYEPGELTIPLSIWAVIQKDIPVIVEQLERVGFKVEATPLETANFFLRMTNGDFEVGLHSFWIGGIDPDMTLYEHFYTGSDRNYGRYSNPEVDRLIDLQSATLDPEKRREIAWDAIEIAWRDGAKHLLSTTIYQPIVADVMQGFMPAPNYLAGYGPMLRFQHVWLK